jgi:mannitol-specific phosphotransferase system IIBC component
MSTRQNLKTRYLAVLVICTISFSAFTQEFHAPKPDYTVPIICLVVVSVCTAILVPYLIVKARKKSKGRPLLNKIKKNREQKDTVDMQTTLSYKEEIEHNVRTSK